MDRYEDKFKGFIKLCATAKKEQVDVVMIHHPAVLGDNYEEMKESLERLAEARLQLMIVPRGERGNVS